MPDAKPATSHRIEKFEDSCEIAIPALFCGAESFEDMELSATPAHGIPSHDTFNRLFAAPDLQRFLMRSCAGR